MVIWLNEQARLLLNQIIEDKDSRGQFERDKLVLFKRQDVDNYGFDTEDDGKCHCHLLVFVHDKDEYIFYDRYHAILWLLFTRWEKETILWCVNTEYDLNNLTWGFECLCDRLYNKTRFIVGRIFNFSNLCQLDEKAKAVRLYDLMNFYSLGAAAVGKLFGLDKLDFDFRKRRHDKDGNVIVSKKEVTYCIADARIAYVAGQFITDKFAEFDVYFAPTVASCAMQIFLKHFDKTGLNQYSVYFNDVPPKVAYSAYYGGRVEAFRIGETITGNIRYYDINSLYPYVMAKYNYPDPMKPSKKIDHVEVSNGVAYCQVYVPEDIPVPPLPWRHDDKLLFPVGRFKGVWCLPEIINAVNCGCVIERVFWCYTYANVNPLFRRYIKAMYKKRQEAESPADNKFYKVLMNSLYGKFGQQQRVTRYEPAWQELNSGGHLVGDYVAQVEHVIGGHDRYIIAAYVTSYARVVLHTWLMDIIDKGGELLYCDTDSIIYRDGPDLACTSQLGGMKLEARIKRISIRGAKYYQYEQPDKTIISVVKGVPKHVQADMFTYGEVTYQKPIRYREALRRHLQANFWVDCTKKSLTEYDKRSILPDGSTLPLKCSLSTPNKG